MRSGHPLPRLWLLSDQRNDDGLEAALAHLPRGSGFVFRHYHLPPQERLARFRELMRICRVRGHCLVLADSARMALEWGGDGIYGAPRMLGRSGLGRRAGLLAIATAHGLGEIAQANRIGADAVMLSPVFPTRSHRGARALGPLRFRLLARRAAMPVIALGGMDPDKAGRLQWGRWAAIDGLSPGEARRNS